jgi:hypothetical protein
MRKEPEESSDKSEVPVWVKIWNERVLNSFMTSSEIERREFRFFRKLCIRREMNYEMRTESRVLRRERAAGLERTVMIVGNSLKL